MNSNQTLLDTLNTLNSLAESFLSVARQQKMNAEQALLKAEQPKGFLWQMAWGMVAKQLEA